MRFVGPLFWLQPILLILGLTAIWVTAIGDSGPKITTGKGTECVAETDFMRRNHMDLIVHQRDDTVLRGIRDQPFSLVECVDCHAQRDASNKPVRIDDEGQFCASCHTYAAVKIDCFSCHAAVPDQSEQSAARSQLLLPQGPLSLTLNHLAVVPDHPAVESHEDNNVIVR